MSRWSSYFEQNKYFHLALMLLILMSTASFIQDNSIWQVVLSSMFFLVILLALRAIIMKKWLFRFCLVLASIEFIIDLNFAIHQPFLVDLNIFNLISFFTYSIFILMSIYIIIKDLVKVEKITKDTIYGGVSGYLLLGLLWSFIYVFLYHFNPNSFQTTSIQSLTFLDFFYYSFSTLTTLGYGDIVPLARFSKILAVQEAISGVLFIAVFVGSIIGRYVAQYVKDQMNQ